MMPYIGTWREAVWLITLAAFVLACLLALTVNGVWLLAGILALVIGLLASQ